MIGYLSGKILHVEDDHLLLDVQGVGYKVYATDASLRDASLSTSLSLFTHHVVREQALDLYGFATKEELAFFELLIGISGIGPKVGLSILNAALPETLYTAVVNEDTSVLTKVSGIGKKNASKIILELKNKVDKFGDAFGITSPASSQDLEVFEALEALGYNPRDIQEVLKNNSFESLDTNTKIREVIKLLGK